MEKIRIQTTQNVDIEYEVAGLGDRFVAAIIDILIIFSYAAAIAILFTLLDLWNANGYIIASLVIFLPIGFYHLFCEIFLEGQSFGKRQMQIKVVKMDGSNVKFGHYLIRWLFRIVDVSISNGGIAVLAIIMNGKGQRLGDMAAGTTVICLKKSTTLNDTLFMETDEAYSMTFDGVNKLTDKDVSLIKEVMEAAKKTENNRVILALAEKVRALLGARADLPPRVFLDTVVKDYNYLHSS